MIKGTIKKLMGPLPTCLDLLPEVSWKQKLHILHYNFRHNMMNSTGPIRAKIEINGSCNLNCVMCFRKTLPHRNRYMSFSEFCIILDHLPKIMMWSPHGYNEPLLHPRLYDFIREGNHRRIRCNLVTNGVRLTPNVTDRLVELAVCKITVSIEAIGKEYDRIRFPAHYPTILNHLKYLKQVRENYNLSVSLASVIWKNNLDQIPALIGLAEELNFPISFWDIGYTHDFGESVKENSVRFNVIKFLDKYQDHPLVNFSLQPKAKRTCTLPWSDVYVDVIGDVYPCTDNIHYRLGNLLLNSIGEIFNSQKAQEFRRLSYTGQNENCRECISWRDKE